MAIARIWRSSGKFRVGAVITLLLILTALLNRLLIHLVIGETEPLQTGSFANFLDPSRAHPLGTERFGRDVLGLVLVGLPNSLLVAAIAGCISTVIGVVIGFFAGYKGGKVDATLRTFTDMFLVIPTLPLIIILAAYVKHVSIAQIAVILAVFSWPFAARVIRAQVLSLRERPYVELAKITNMRDWEIIVQEILPNMLPYIGIGFATSALGAAFALVGLEIIGLGPSDTMDLGLLINFAQQWGVLSLGKWAIFAAPVGLLVLLFFGVVLINQGLEEFYNPRLRVVDGANLTIHRGEIFGLAGESGCGKTTLVEAILQIIRFPNRIARGHVSFSPDDQTPPVDLMALSPAQLRRFRWEHISYVPQGSMNSLNPVMRIGDQIIDGMTAHGVHGEEARAKVPVMLEKVGLEGRVGRLYPHELSGGMKQRAIIATAIAMDPELIIADEPTTALDVNVQRVILDTLLQLRRDLGVAILIVSHDLPVHAQLVDRIGIMYAGKVVEIGDVRPVLKNALHPYTQGLMDSIPAIGGERKRLGGIAGVSPSPLERPGGCPFHPRCPHAMDICATRVPALAAIAPGPRTIAGEERAVEPARFTACHLYPESTARSNE